MPIFTNSDISYKIMTSDFPWKKVKRSVNHGTAAPHENTQLELNSSSPLLILHISPNFPVLTIPYFSLQPNLIHFSLPF